MVTERNIKYGLQDLFCRFIFIAQIILNFNINQKQFMFKFDWFDIASEDKIEHQIEMSKTTFNLNKFLLLSENHFF